MNQDKKTTIEELKDLLIKFRNKRNWNQFHDPKNLAEAISIEAGELQELFLWKNKEEVYKKMKDPNFKKEVEEELADVIIFCFNFSNSIDLDISSTVKRKIKINDQKYPINKSKGLSKKYNEL